ncbi:MAG: PPC domain-containing protein, partial [Acidobacteria bacterium]|nr:PPC domain-containing protein [Acidobacteriota bacterium]
HQEGLVGGEANVHRSVGSAAMDGSGNIAIGYTRTGTTAPYYPSIYFRGRYSTDPAGTMPQGEYVIQDATTSKTNNERWGDYAGIGIDPVDDCTFWFTTEYGGSGATRVAAFKFDGCGGATYSISGTVSGTVVSGVTMTLSGAGTGTTTTAANGTYTFSGRANGSYTVTPSLAGYTFSPANSAVTVSGANVTGVNFTSSAAPTYSISGTVSGAIAAGVTINLTGAATASTTTAADGTYSFSSLANGSYTVTPSRSGYTFSPTSTAVTISGANQTGKNFVATAVATYSISGTVSGAIATGVTVNLTGAGTGSTTTDGSGNYAFSGLANGSYTVTPSLSGYTFSPTSIAVTLSGANQTGKNFTSTAVGGDTPLTSGVGVAGSVAYQTWKYYTIVVPSGATNLAVTLTGLSADIDLYVNNSTTHPTTSSYYGRSWNGGTTNESLSYSSPTVAAWSIGVYGYAAGSYTVTATVTTSTPTYSISGTVSGAVAAGVTMNLTGAATATTTTITGGTYTFSGLANGSYTVTPSLAGYTFSPTSLAVTISGANQTGKNFTSTSTGGPVTLFTNGFEGTTGWAQVDTSGTAGTWSQVTSGTYPTCSKHGGTYMAKFNSYNASSGSATRYYRTAGFAIGSSYTTVTLTFWMYHDTGYSTYADKVQPQVSTNGTTWTAVGSAINRYDGSTGWKQHTVSLTTYKGSTVQLGFLGTSAYGNNIYLDDALVVAQ